MWSSNNDGYVVQALDPDAAYGPDTPSETLSTFLGRPVFLIQKGPRPRVVEPTPSFPDLNTTTAFQDGYPILIATDASIADMAIRVRSAALVDDADAEKEGAWKIHGLDKDLWKEKELAIERFRPNIVLGADDLVPYDEERWEEVIIGDHGSRMLLVSLCHRCQVGGSASAISLPTNSFSGTQYRH